MEVANQKDEKNKPIIRDQTYFNCDKLLAIYFFFWFVFLICFKENKQTALWSR